MARSISKNRLVRSVFSELAPVYDQLEPQLTWRQGKLWRQRAITLAKLDSPRRILDACAGTGLMTVPLANAFGTRCHVIGIDFCPQMLAQARQKLQAQNLLRRVELKLENVEIMPFPNEFFDAVFISFGLRFVSDIRVVLKEFQRVLKPGGRAVVLEFGIPRGPIRKWQAHWRREFSIPLRAGLTHHLPGAVMHPLLHDSLVYYPDAERLSRMFMRTGFEQISYKIFKGGVANLHVATKPG